LTGAIPIGPQTSVVRVFLILVNVFFWRREREPELKNPSGSVYSVTLGKSSMRRGASWWFCNVFRVYTCDARVLEY